MKTGGGLRGNWTGGPHGGGSSITDLAFEEHAARARTGTRDRTTSGTASGRQGGRARRVLPKRTSCTQGHGYHRELQSPGPSKWRMGLPGSRPLKEQGRGKEIRPKEPGKKLKSGFLNTYYAPARAGARPVLPLPTGTGCSTPAPALAAGTGAPAGGGRVSIKTPVLSALLPKDDGLSLGRLDAVFPSFPRPLTRHLGLRSRVTHWLTNSPPDVGYWNAQPSP